MPKPKKLRTKTMRRVHRGVKRFIGRVAKMRVEVQSMVPVYDHIDIDLPLDFLGIDPAIEHDHPTVVAAAKRYAENLLADDGLTIEWKIDDGGGTEIDVVDAEPIPRCPKCGEQANHRCQTGDCLHCDNEACLNVWVPKE